MYDTVIEANRFQMIKRTEGTSTTVLIGRLLSMSKEHLITAPQGERSAESKAGAEDSVEIDHGKLQSMAMLLPTAERISQFADVKARNKDIASAQQIVYIDGSFDLFHYGHLKVLQAAAELGDFVLVGLHKDDVVNKNKGRNYPIMNIHERALCVMSCKYANEVILGAPETVTQDLITSMNIKVVVTGQLDKFPDSAVDP